VQLHLETLETALVGDGALRLHREVQLVQLSELLLKLSQLVLLHGFQADGGPRTQFMNLKSVVRFHMLLVQISLDFLGQLSLQV
jgi:hypothetical protein